MRKIRNIIFKIIILLIYADPSKSQYARPGYYYPTEETITIRTTTEEVVTYLDISQAEVDEIVNVDYGKYTTMKFEYFNKQLEYPEIHEPKDWKYYLFYGWYSYKNKQMVCVDDYTKCIVNQVTLTPVCAFNNLEDYSKGFKTFNSYCSLYFDNCRKGYRFWRPVDFGYCNIYWYYLPVRTYFWNVKTT